MTREELRRHLDRKPPTGIRGEGSPWRRWFDGEEYLGERSARTGPDTGSPCFCDVCRNGRQNAKVGSGRTNGGKLGP